MRQRGVGCIHTGVSQRGVHPHGCVTERGGVGYIHMGASQGGGVRCIHTGVSQGLGVSTQVHHWGGCIHMGASQGEGGVHPHRCIIERGEVRSHGCITRRGGASTQVRHRLECRAGETVRDSHQHCRDVASTCLTFTASRGTTNVAPVQNTPLDPLSLTSRSDVTP